MQAVGVREQHRQGEHKEKEVADQEVGTPQRELDDLDDKLASRLRHDVVAEAAAVPLASPPSTVGLVVLELARQED